MRQNQLDAFVKKMDADDSREISFRELVAVLIDTLFGPFSQEEIDEEVENMVQKMKSHAGFTDEIMGE